MDPTREKHLDKIYRLSDNITESRARMLSIVYNEQEGGLTAEKVRSARIENLRIRINQLTLTRQEEIRRLYSNGKMKQERSPSPSPSSSPTSSPTPSPASPRSENKQRLVSPSTTPRSLSTVTPPPPSSPHPKSVSSASSTHDDNTADEPPEEPSKWSSEPVPSDEKAYYEKCRQYYNITEKPLLSISENIFHDHVDLPSASLVCYIDEDANEFDVDVFLRHISDILQIDDITVSKIQRGCVKVIFEVFKKVDGIQKKIEVKALYESMTDDTFEALGKLKVLFMFMGDILVFNDTLKFRDQITLYPKWNRIYAVGHMHWDGAIQDGRDRGPHPYFCPVGWQRYSFYVTNHFDEKFKGWSICYHGTKFAYGLSILLSGLKPATAIEHGAGIYASPSIIYTAHPRYSEVKRIASVHEQAFFKNGKYIQFVLECRVHPGSIVKIGSETLRVSEGIIDRNLDNDAIEWLVDTQDKPIMDFNDPNSPIVCTGLMVRVTDNHPGLLPESQWWYKSHLCNNPKCCLPDIDPDDLRKQKQEGIPCNVIFN